MKRASSLISTESTVSRNIDDSAYDNVKIVADNIDAVVPVGESILDGSLTVAIDNIDSINTNAANISDINTVSTNIAGVNTVSNSMPEIQNVLSNLPEILLSDDNATIATEQALIATAQAELATILLDQFDDRYLGSKDSDPLLDNDGNALLIGALYWSNTVNKMRVWDGTVWSDSLTLTETSISTITNKTLDSYTNRIKANAVHMRVKNQSGVVMPKGTVVSYFGYSDTEDAVKVVKANSSTDIAIGILAEDLGVDAFGMAIANGIIDGLDTSAYTNGTILYTDTNGGLTNIEPTTGFAQPVAYVLKSNANIGVLQVLAAYPKQDASDVRVAAAGNISATDVQSALQELDSEKAEVAGSNTQTFKVANAINYDEAVTKLQMDALASEYTTVTDFTAHTGAVNPHSVTKAQVGLGNADNTSDVDKPISTATQTALDGKVDDSQVLTNVPAGAVFTDTAYTAGSGLSLVGTEFSNSSQNVTTDLGYTASTTNGVVTSSDGTDATIPLVVASGNAGLMTGADKTKLNGIEDNATADQTASEIEALYEGITDTNKYTDAEKALLASHTSSIDNPHSVTKAQIGLSEVDNTSDIDKPVSTAAETAINAVDGNALAYAIALG